jgi:hypothetical protein
MLLVITILVDAALCMRPKALLKCGCLLGWQSCLIASLIAMDTKLRMQYGKFIYWLLSGLFGLKN